MAERRDRVTPPGSDGLGVPSRSRSELRARLTVLVAGTESRVLPSPPICFLKSGNCGAITSVASGPSRSMDPLDVRNEGHPVVTTRRPATGCHGIADGFKLTERNDRTKNVRRRLRPARPELSP